MKKKEEKEVLEVEKAEVAEPEPNVAFAGREWRIDPETGKEKLIPSRFAPEKVNTATATLKLPDSEVQVSAGAKGFYSEHGDYLKRNFPAPKGKVAGVFYKEPKAKGD